jgi:16S rRNA (cytidine1402-2'-O)-methyltransferase
MEKLKSGSSIALVSKAGTPLISDPGYRLVQAAVDENIPVVPIPGVSAVITALSSAGLPTDAFVFEGFLPRVKGKRIKKLEALAVEHKTVIFYESPHRILVLLNEIKTTMGDRYGVICREMTKQHEEFLRGSISYLIDDLGSRQKLRGEFTLLIEGTQEKGEISFDRVHNDIKTELDKNKQSLSTLVKKIAKKYGIPKQVVYGEALRLKDETD